MSPKESRNANEMVWRARQDLNLRPSDPKSDALSVELRALIVCPGCAVPSRSLCSPPPVAVGAYYVALGNLPLERLQRVASDQNRDIRLFIAQVVEFQHDHVALAAVDARVRTIVLHKKGLVGASLLFVSRTCLLDVRRAMGLVMPPHVFVLAALAGRMPSSAAAIANGKAVERLWQSALATDFHIHAVTTAFGNRHFRLELERICLQQDSPSLSLAE